MLLQTGKFTMNVETAFLKTIGRDFINEVRAQPLRDILTPVCRWYLGHICAVGL